MKKLGMEQLQSLFDAFSPHEGASYRCVEEPYGGFLRAMAPSPEELDAQRAHPPATAPLFALRLLGNWSPELWGRTLSSLAVQTYARFNITQKAAACRGDYVLHLWPGDVLAPDALYHFAKAAEAGADLIYCDEDIYAPAAPFGRAEPFFKSCPSRITQLSYDLLSCGVAAVRALYDRAGAPAKPSPEARYEYNLRCLSLCRRARHIPRPLYTLGEDRRPGRILRPPLSKGETASGGQWRGSLRVERMPRKRPKVAIIIPNLDGCMALRRLLESIEAQTLYPYGPILIADMGSRDVQTLRYYSLLEKNGAAWVIQGRTLSKLLNSAALSAKAEVLVFLGRDTEILSPNWLESLLGQLYRPGVGAAGGKLVDGLGRLRHCGGVGGLGGWAASFYEGSPDTLSSLRQNRFANSIRAVSFLSLSCLALTASVFFEAGGFHAELDRAGLDINLCLRLRQRGLACVYTPYALLRCHAPLASMDEAPAWDQRRCREALDAALADGDPHCSLHYDLSQPIPVCRA